MPEAAVVLETEEEAPPVVDAEEQSYIDRASRMGWKPKDQYGGDSSRWVDARTFVMRGEAELPILRERFRKLDDRLASTDTKLKDTEKKLTEATEVLVELRDMSRTAEERAYGRARNELLDRQRAAVAEASVEKFEAAAREMDQLQPPKAASVRTEPPKVELPPAPVAPQPNPAAKLWIDENPWFNTDRVLNMYAIDEERQVQAEYPAWTVADQLDEVKKRVMDRFPEKFGNKRRTAPASVATPSSPAPRPKGKTVKDLPADARAALEKFKKQIPGYKDDDYLSMYFSDAEA